MEDIKRAAIYVRVSTDEQTTENQLPELLRYAMKRDFEVVKVYKEEASAWRAGHQKQLKELLKQASVHKYDVLLVWSIDRLTRQGIGYVMQLFSAFNSYGCQVISIQESWTEQSGPVADLLTAIVGWVAEFESKRRSERIKAAIARKKERGEPVGRLTGCKDKKKRKRTGYLLRYADRR